MYMHFYCVQRQIPNAFFFSPENELVKGKRQSKITLGFSVCIFSKERGHSFALPVGFLSV